MDRLRTALCGLLEIEYPIVQSGMGAVAGPELVAEVCEAGGLGILAALNQPPDVMREAIRKVRVFTSGPVEPDSGSSVNAPCGLTAHAPTAHAPQGQSNQ